MRVTRRSKPKSALLSGTTAMRLVQFSLSGSWWGPYMFIALSAEVAERGELGTGHF